MPLLLKPNPSSGVPIYVQLKEQIRHAVEVGALQTGEPLPAMRALAEQLVVNANTVARVYRELEQEGLLDLRHGIGAFVSEFGPAIRQATARAGSIGPAREAIRSLVRRLRDDGFSSDEIRRLVEAELDPARTATVSSRSSTARLTATDWMSDASGALDVPPRRSR
jgi:GntR family transcriptional regulator